MEGECLEPEQSMKEGGDAHEEQTTAGQSDSVERAENAESTLGESARIDSAPPGSRQAAQDPAHSVFGVRSSSAPSSGGGLALGEGTAGNEPREQQQSVLRTRISCMLVLVAELSFQSARSLMTSFG